MTSTMIAVANAVFAAKSAVNEAETTHGPYSLEAIDARNAWVSAVAVAHGARLVGA